MKTLATSFDEIEDIAARESWVHSRDPRAKIIVAIGFLVTLASFERHAVGALMPMALLVVSFATCGSISFRWMTQKLLLPVIAISIFGAANLLFERNRQGVILGFWATDGLFSWCSIILRATLALGVSLILVSTTGILRLSEGLAALKVPQIIVTLLLLLYRYIFVLAAESSRMNRARSCRAFGTTGFEIATASAMLGQLLVRSLARAERIHTAMLSRGLGDSSVTTHGSVWQLSDTILVMGSFALLFAFRTIDFVLFAEQIILKAFS
jgi:cobalt/nickel transport system permease protein